eukprot:TRINITY_DN30317_c0_g1_i1.p1 TRINITY_DN30317_c0_g1~~TRINITY_DN30317_c0_g1_i1.p1  ORF type:complete len:618 (-),score=64.36 TRINITY_DN30317_c0_g1_i1:810-2663(-)
MTGASMAESSIPIRWARGSLLGCGSFGSVNMGLDLSAGRLIAVKSVDADGPSQSLSALQTEYSILKSLESDRLVRCLGADWTVEGGVRKHNLLLEHMPGGSVADVMKQFGGKLEEGLVRKFTREMLEGVRDLHAAGYAHCDIKGQNLLLGSNGVKICDLGSAQKLPESPAVAAAPDFLRHGICRAESELNSHDNFVSSISGQFVSSLSPSSPFSASTRAHRSPSFTASSGIANMEISCREEVTSQPDSTTPMLPLVVTPLHVPSLSRVSGTGTPNRSRLVGTICWMAPEVVKSSQLPSEAHSDIMAPGASADIWSVGCTVIEMLSGKLPWGRHATSSASVLFQLGCTEALPEVPSFASAHCHDFVALCLQRDALKRPSAEVLLSHPFLSLNSSMAPPVLARASRSRSMSSAPFSISTLSPSPSSLFTRIEPKYSAALGCKPADVTQAGDQFQPSGPMRAVRAQSLNLHTTHLVANPSEGTELASLATRKRRSCPRRSSADLGSPPPAPTQSRNSSFSRLDQPLPSPLTPGSSSPTSSFWSSIQSPTGSQGPWLVVRSPDSPRAALARRNSLDACASDLHPSAHMAHGECNAVTNRLPAVTSRFAPDVVMSREIVQAA